MTAVALESHAPTEGQRCYLDASALIALAYEDAASAGVAVRADERSRARRVREYVLRVRRLGARLVTSILAMEELAAMTRNKARDIASRPLGRSWVELKRDAPDDARRVDELCRQQMLDTMEHAAKATGDLGVSFELPVVLEGDASAAATRLQRVYDVARAATPEGTPDGDTLDAAGRVRNAQLNERRNVLEPRLRRFVRRVLEGALGPERWLDPVLAVLPSQTRRQVEGVSPDEVLSKRLLLSNLIEVIDANWGSCFAPALEAGRTPDARVTRAQVRVLLEHVNAHREDAHARPITDADFASVTIAIEQLLRVIGEG